MKKQDKSKQIESHNVYYVNNNYRLRLYQNDRKIFEKQMHIPNLSYYSLFEQVQDILFRFIDKIGQGVNIEDKKKYYTERMLHQMNEAYMFACMLEELRK